MATRTFRRILLILALLATTLPITLWFAGSWWLRARLAEGIRAGEGRIMAEGVEIRPSLSFVADTLAYSAVTATATGETLIGITGLRGDLDLFDWPFTFSPRLTLRLDTLRIRLQPGRPPPDAAPEEPGLDSLAYPDFRFPGEVSLNAARLAVLDDSGLVAALEDVRLESRGERAARLRVARLMAPALDTLSPSAAISLDWGRPDSVWLEAGMRRGPDSVRLVARLDKENILAGVARLEAGLTSTRPYAAVFEAPEALPRATSVDLRLQAGFGERPFLDGLLTATIRDFDTTLPVRAWPRDVRLALDILENQGNWSLSAQGREGEAIRLQGRLSVPDTAEGLGDLAREVVLTLEGSLESIPLQAGGEWVAMDLRIPEARLSMDHVEFRMETGDESSVAADLRRGEAGWTGDFRAELERGERILEAFLDTSVRFTRAALRGELRPGGALIDSRLYGVRAYGVVADSVHATHAIDSAGYALRPSTLFRGGDAWRVSGGVEFGEAFNPLSFTASHPRHGALAFSMPDSGVISVSADRLHIAALPYSGLDTLPVRDPVATGRFRWDRPADRGSLRADIDATYAGERMSLRGRAAWTPDSLFLPVLVESHDGSRLHVEGRVHLGRNAFYEFGKVKPDDIGRLSVQAEDFDLARALRVFLEESPLVSGRLEGALSYSARRGLRGEYRVEDLALRDAPAGLSITGLSLRGTGDSLILSAATHSEDIALLDDSIRVVVEGLLEETRRISARLVAAESLTAAFQGTLTGFERLAGRLSVEGRASLPGEAGRLSALDVRADMVLPLDSLLQGLRVEADTFQGRYTVPGLDTQWFSGTLLARNGLLRVPELEIRNREGRALRGEAAFRYLGETLLRAELGGGDLALRLPGGREADLDQVQAFLRMDRSGTLVRGSFVQGRITHHRPPLQVRAGLRDVEFSYRMPAAESGPGRRDTADPSLRLTATLEDSRLVYRLRSIEAIEEFFGGFGGGNDENAGRKEKGAAQGRVPPDREAQAATAGPQRPLRLDLRLRAVGDSNVVDSEILRAALVGNVDVAGTSESPILTGRVRALEGELGFQGQSYGLRQFEVEWPGVPLSEGRVDLRAAKDLAATCEPEEEDSCSVTTLLQGTLSDLAFNYESDCGGGFGAAANVAALVNSVRRGCYSPEFFAGGAGGAAGAGALGLLEPILSRNISRVVERLSGRWISRTEVSGLAAFTEGAHTEEVTLRLVSREFWRLRLEGAAFYHPGAQEFYNPWEYLLAVAWRPPFRAVMENDTLARRLEEDISLRATLETDPESRFRTEEDEIRRRVETNYDHGFWRFWWED
jgi:hypothetical protein